jgi:uncharacterized protein YneF (UPF0154 family)
MINLLIRCFLIFLLIVTIAFILYRILGATISCEAVTLYTKDNIPLSVKICYQKGSNRLLLFNIEQ